VGFTRLSKGPMAHKWLGTLALHRLLLLHSHPPSVTGVGKIKALVCSEGHRVAFAAIIHVNRGEGRESYGEVAEVKFWRVHVILRL
jgi:hypothetical protein